MFKEIKLKRGNVCYTSDQKLAIYYSMLKCPDGILRLYTNRWVGKYETCCIENTDGRGCNFGKELIKILDKSGATHNFSPFYGRNKKLYGIGGVDNWKFDKSFHDIKNYNDFKKVYEEKFQRDSSKEVFEHNEHRRLLSNKKILKHVRGLYLFESENGIRWKEVQSDPIITTRNEGFIDAIKNFGKGSEFDGHVNCVYDAETDLYFIYLRANVNIGFRYIQYATSKDLINWSKFQLINIETYDGTKDNYYIPSFFKYKKKFVGLIPYFDKEKCSIRIMSSADGINFKIHGVFFKENSAIFKDFKPKNTCHPVQGFFTKNGIVTIYIHHNNLALDKTKPVEVVRHTITEKEFDEVLSC